MDIFLQQLVNGLTLGSVYAIVALGYTMVYGIVQLINFAHGEVVMVGAMVSLSVIAALAGTAALQEQDHNKLILRAAEIADAAEAAIRGRTETAAHATQVHTLVEQFKRGLDIGVLAQATAVAPAAAAASSSADRRSWAPPRTRPPRG